MVKKRIRSSAICVNGGKILVVHLQDPGSGSVDYYLPGGEIEPGESAGQAAIRETQEETGYGVTINSAPFTDEYGFLWGGDWIHCFTTYYIVDLQARVSEKIIDGTAHRGWSWVDMDQALAGLFRHCPSINRALSHFGVPYIS